MKLYCHECRKKTNQKMLAEEKVTSDPRSEEHFGADHYFSKCAGCDSLNYSIAEWHEYDFDENLDEMRYSWSYYPYSPGDRQEMEKTWDFPSKIRNIYREVIKANNGGLRVLTAIGLRALIETVCKDQNILGSNLEKKIDGMATSGILTTGQAKILHGHRFLGNIAAHQVKQADSRELEAALDIAENMLYTIYVTPKLSKSLPTGP